MKSHALTPGVVVRTAPGTVRKHSRTHVIKHVPPKVAKSSVISLAGGQISLPLGISRPCFGCDVSEFLPTSTTGGAMPAILFNPQKHHAFNGEQLLHPGMSEAIHVERKLSSIATGILMGKACFVYFPATSGSDQKCFDLWYELKKYAPTISTPIQEFHLVGRKKKFEYPLSWITMGPGVKQNVHLYRFQEPILQELTFPIQLTIEPG